MARTIVMGNPRYFSVLGGANPHTRNFLGMRKRVNPKLAQDEWHGLAKTLIAYGAEVLVIEPHPRLSGLVYPANAGFLCPLNGNGALKKFYLANLIVTRAPEQKVYEQFTRGLGYETTYLRSRFEGEADFFPAGQMMIFTYGCIEKQEFRFRAGIPPWKRIYGFRSEGRAYRELARAIAPWKRPILPLQLCLETYYHGDTALCSFGPDREYLLAYLPALTEQSRRRLREHFDDRLIELCDEDAARYAANSFQIEHKGRYYLMMPEGVSDALIRQIRERGVEPVLVGVGEFLKKGGGSIKCMILDMGPSDEQPQSSAAIEFRLQHRYRGS